MASWVDADKGYSAAKEEAAAAEAARIKAAEDAAAAAAAAAAAKAARDAAAAQEAAAAAEKARLEAEYAAAEAAAAAAKSAAEAAAAAVAAAAPKLVPTDSALGKNWKEHIKDVDFATAQAEAIKRGAWGVFQSNLNQYHFIKEGGAGNYTTATNCPNGIWQLTGSAQEVAAAQEKATALAAEHASAAAIVAANAAAKAAALSKASADANLLAAAAAALAAAEAQHAATRELVEKMTAASLAAKLPSFQPVDSALGKNWKEYIKDADLATAEEEAIKRGAWGVFQSNLKQYHFIMEGGTGNYTTATNCPNGIWQLTK